MVPRSLCRPRRAAQAASLAEVLLTTQLLYVRDYRAGVMLYSSPGVGRVLGYPAAAIDFDRLYFLIHPDDRALVTDATALANLLMKTCPGEPADHYQFSVDSRTRHARGTISRRCARTWSLSATKPARPWSC